MPPACIFISCTLAACLPIRLRLLRWFTGRFRRLLLLLSLWLSFWLRLWLRARLSLRTRLLLHPGLSLRLHRRSASFHLRPWLLLRH